MIVNEGVATEAKGQDQRPREDDLSRVIWTLKKSAKDLISCRAVVSLLEILLQFSDYT